MRVKLIGGVWIMAVIALMAANYAWYQTWSTSTHVCWDANSCLGEDYFRTLHFMGSLLLVFFSLIAWGGWFAFPHGPKNDDLTDKGEVDVATTE